MSDDRIEHFPDYSVYTPGTFRTVYLPASPGYPEGPPWTREDVAMTTDAKQIEPAMDAEEWQAFLPLRAAMMRGMENDPEVALAIANMLLPDDSPYKITRADVDRLHDIAVELESATDIPGAMGSGRTLHALADKLAALLPPGG